MRARCFDLLSIFCSGQARAQVQTYTYTGQPFDPSACVDGGDYTFQAGSVTGQATFVGLAPGYSGTIFYPNANISSVSLSGPQGHVTNVSVLVTRIGTQAEAARPLTAFQARRYHDITSLIVD